MDAISVTAESFPRGLHVCTPSVRMGTHNHPARSGAQLAQWWRATGAVRAALRSRGVNRRHQGDSGTSVRALGSRASITGAWGRLQMAACRLCFWQRFAAKLLKWRKFRNMFGSWLVNSVPGTFHLFN